MFAIVLISLLTVISIMNCTHLIDLDKDFSRVKADPKMSKDPVVKHVVNIIKKSKLFQKQLSTRNWVYIMLHRAIRAYTQKNSDTLYHPTMFSAKGVPPSPNSEELAANPTITHARLDLRKHANNFVYDSTESE